MVPKASGKRLTEWPILPSKLSLKIAKKCKSAVDLPFLCLLEKKFPELFKTSLTFITKPLLRAPESFKLEKQVLGGYPLAPTICHPIT